MAEMIALHNGQILNNVHDAGTCLLGHCSIHNPSEHPLNTAPLAWLNELRMLFRVCEHDYLHPDPDEIDFHLATLDFMTVEAVTSVHLMEENCDGCCQGRAA